MFKSKDITSTTNFREGRLFSRTNKCIVYFFISAEVHGFHLAGIL